MTAVRDQIYLVGGNWDINVLRYGNWMIEDELSGRYPDTYIDSFY